MYTEQLHVYEGILCRCTWLCRIRKERWLDDSHLTAYALGFGYHILSSFTRDASWGHVALSPVPEPTLAV